MRAMGGGSGSVSSGAGRRTGARRAALLVVVVLLAAVPVVVAPAEPAAAASIRVAWPNMSQADSRWGAHYYGGDSTGKGSANRPRIAECGCFLTVWANVLRNEFGDPADAGGTSPWYPTILRDATGREQLSLTWNPKYIDLFTRYGKGGYPDGRGTGYADVGECGGAILPWTLEKAGLPAFAGDVQITGSGIAVTDTISGALTAEQRSVIVQRLRAGDPTPVVRSDPNHMQLIVAYELDPFPHFRILDPGSSRDAPSEMPQDEGDTQRERYLAWERKVKSILTYEVVQEPSHGWFGIIDDPAPVDFFLVDPLGRREGVDPTTGSVHTEQPSGFVSRAEGNYANLVDGTSASLPSTYAAARNPVEGTWRVAVRGTGAGPATYRFYSVLRGEQTMLRQIDEDVQPGAVRRFQAEWTATGALAPVEVARFTPEARAGEDVQTAPGTVVELDARASFGVDAPIASYRWDAGDGTAPVDGPVFSQTFATPGVRTLTLTVTDAAGAVDTDTVVVDVVDPAGTVPLEEVTAGNGSTAAASAMIDARGQHVAYLTNAPVITADRNQVSDVYLRDRLTGATELVSRRADGTPFPLTSTDFYAGMRGPDLSSDARYASWMTRAVGVPDDTNGTVDVYVRDRTDATTRRVSLTASGGQASADVFGSEISDDGTAVLMTSSADLAEDGRGGGIFVRDVAAATTQRVALLPDGGVAPSPLAVELSADGRLALFTSGGQVYVRDRLAQTTELVSVSDDEIPGNGDSAAAVSMSADGNVAAFASSATNLVAGPDANGGAADVYVRDRAVGSTRRVNVSTSGTQANAGSFVEFTATSATGRHVAFTSNASNLVANDTNGRKDLFVRDLQAGRTTRISTRPDGTSSSGGIRGIEGFFDVAMGADGATVFSSDANDLVSTTADSGADVFLWRPGVPRPVADAGGPYIGWASDDAAPATVRLDASRSVTPAGVPATATWDPGDGSGPVEGGLVLDHVYRVPGTYTATVVVSTPDAASRAATTTVTVHPAVGADELAVAPSCAARGGSYTVTGTARQPAAALLAGGWNLSEGPLPALGIDVTLPGGTVVAVPVALPSLTVTHSAVVPLDFADGVHAVTASTGASATLVVPCPAGENAVPRAHAGGPRYVVDVGAPLRLDGSRSSDADGDVLTYAWDLGDGTTAAGATPEHTYDVAGDYLVRLAVSDGTATSSARPGDPAFALVTVTAPRETGLALDTASTVQWSDALAVTATLTTTDDGAPVTGRLVAVRLAASDEYDLAPTDESGVARGSVVVDVDPGAVTLSARHDAGGGYTAATAARSLAVVHEDCALTYTGDSNVAAGATTQLSASFAELDASVGDVSGRGVTFVLTDSAGAVTTMTAVTDGSGGASAALPLPGGVYSVDVRFEGDAHYAPCASAPALVTVEGGATGTRANGGGSVAVPSAGRVHLGFTVARDHDGAPKGQLQLRSRDHRFHAAVVESLAPRGARGLRWTGVGAFDGVDGYRYDVTVVDGDTKRADTLDIVVRDPAGAVVLTTSGPRTSSGGQVTVHDR